MLTVPKTVNVLPDPIDAVADGLTIKAPNTLSSLKVQFELMIAVSDPDGTRCCDQFLESEKFELTAPTNMLSPLPDIVAICFTG
jgi:hypothetical protein